jgi:hypothetical protein
MRSPLARLSALSGALLMTGCILVGYDGSDRGADAAAWNGLRDGASSDGSETLPPEAGSPGDGGLDASAPRDASSGDDASMDATQPDAHPDPVGVDAGGDAARSDAALDASHARDDAGGDSDGDAGSVGDAASDASSNEADAGDAGPVIVTGEAPTCNPLSQPNCQLECSDTPHCSPTCQAGQLACSADCNGSAFCSPTCAAFTVTECRFDCQDTNRCAATCQAGGSCTVDCTHSKRCNETRCDSGAGCLL